jgi:Guanine nucleotide exchange factor synembryn
MDFPPKLRDVLLILSDDCNLANEGSRSKLADCSDYIEAHFSNPSGRFSPGDMPDTTSELLSALAQSLQFAVLAAASDTAVTPDANLEQVAQSTTLQLPTAFGPGCDNDSRLQLTAELMRATKNLLRWYMQILLATRPAFSPPPLGCLQSCTMLEFYLQLIQHTHGDDSNPRMQEVARNASLALFYSTFSLSRNDDNKGLLHLVDTLDFLPKLLRMLLQCNTTPVLLSLTRLLHSALESLPGTVRKLNACCIDYELGSAPWAPRSDSEAITFRSMLFCILTWALMSHPPFPGDASDRRADLAVEILRIFYVLRVGKDLSAADSHQVKFLMNVSGRDPRSYQVKLATVTLLMDTPPSFAAFFLENGMDALLQVLDQQVSEVVDHTILGNQAATALVPILAVLNAFSIASNDFRRVVKELVFPPEAEEEFWAKAQQESTRANGHGVGAKNMSPLDAPRGTLRWKLVRLLTWTESHTKRLTSELLWTLCGSDAKEFVLRLGFGNALPMLGLKGLVQLPSQLSS